MNENEDYELTFHPRESESISLQIPVETLKSIQKIAAARDMSEIALLKFYIGQGLREDLARQYSDQVLETTAEVLAKHIDSEEEVSAILREIRSAYSVD